MRRALLCFLPSLFPTPPCPRLRICEFRGCILRWILRNDVLALGKGMAVRVKWQSWNLCDVDEATLSLPLTCAIGWDSGAECLPLPECLVSFRWIPPRPLPHVPRSTFLGKLTTSDLAFAPNNCIWASSLCISVIPDDGEWDTSGPGFWCWGGEGVYFWSDFRVRRLCLISE